MNFQIISKNKLNSTQEYIKELFICDEKSQYFEKNIKKTFNRC